MNRIATHVVIFLFLGWRPCGSRSLFAFGVLLLVVERKAEVMKTSIAVDRQYHVPGTTSRFWPSSIAVLALLVFASAARANEPAEESGKGDLAAAEKALKSYGEFAVGGVWKTTEKAAELVDGKWTPTGKTNDVVHQYRWFGKGKFLQLSGTTNGEKDDGITVIGIDPETNKLTWWGFGDQGLGKFTMTLEREGEWILAGEFTTPDGDRIVWKTKAVWIGQDEIRLTPVESSLNGVKQDLSVDVSIWTRHRE